MKNTNKPKEKSTEDMNRYFLEKEIWRDAFHHNEQRIANREHSDILLIPIWLTEIWKSDNIRYWQESPSTGYYTLLEGMHFRKQLTFLLKIYFMTQQFLDNIQGKFLDIYNRRHNSNIHGSKNLEPTYVHRWKKIDPDITDSSSPLRCFK